MTFVQIIDYKTSRQDDLNQLLDRYVSQSQGKRTVTHSIMGKDRENENHYVELVEFPSYEDAMKNSHLPETDKMFQEMVALCDGMPSFTNLDVVRDEHLNKLMVDKMFDEIAMKGNLGVIEEIFASGYIDHDTMKDEESVTGRDVIRQDVTMWRNAFDFTFDTKAQLAEGDCVTTVWSWTGTHKGEFMGIAPTGKRCTMTGTTTFRCQDGMIAEGWWHMDAMGLMRQLGAL
ncbi:ester cyclase [Streptomyces sp. ISL-44]|uniref:ester cyclase n=1 Tax=Streptomyces sp. ISL-44 TaxID=2819184 RepID=UPI001BE6DC92|nr:ester cyclase [Streptomyces sp. ISL-44]MBT2542155.1 ester cyclase [Streptomyces sp. ISL-44]